MSRIPRVFSHEDVSDIKEETKDILEFRGGKYSPSLRRGLVRSTCFRTPAALPSTDIPPPSVHLEVIVDLGCRVCVGFGV